MVFTGSYGHSSDGTNFLNFFTNLFNFAETPSSLNGSDNRNFLETSSSFFNFSGDQKLVEIQSSFVNSSDDQAFQCTHDNHLKQLLAESFLESETDGQFLYDFTSTPTHRLIFEFPLKKSSEKDNYDFFMRFFNTVFLDIFQKYIKLKEASFLLLKHPNQTNGLQIHVIGVEISYDDYNRLCDLMKEACQYEEEDLSVYLECPSSFVLPSCQPMPIRYVHVEFEYHRDNCLCFSRHLESAIYPQSNVNSFCNKMTNFSFIWEEIVRGMIPFPRSNVTYIHFPAKIIEDHKADNTILFQSHLNGKKYTINKANILVEGKGFCYDFMKDNSNHIDLIYAEYPIFETWYNRFKQTHSELTYFGHLDMLLRQYFPHLKGESSPLTTVLKAHERPVYYALYNILIEKKDAILIHEQFPFLSKDLPPVPPPEAAELTFDTIRYCAHLTGTGTFVDHLVTGYEWIIKSIRSLNDLINSVLWIQQRVYPVVREPTDRERPLENPSKIYFWDPNTENWIHMQDPISNMSDILQRSMEIVNSYDEFPPEFIKIFQDELQYLAPRIVYTSPEKIGHNATEPLEMYGHNVPEYYFLEDKM